ncbi:hypothetical protein DSO57_1031439 [Entomophthora muscae]|uniref:Uncharacterized protein n=1 Tax=Entomophthora muscae TaxID=34485 RepID=A0ACC2TC77_9FUNG|nr:hypothetical protein DSO57_1031439 [Entomophthora muscae]
MHQRKPLAPFCQICDVCNAGIFSAYWFCKACGIELCLDCFSTEKHRSLATCIQSTKHSSVDFIPMTNYSIERISKFHASVKAFEPIECELNAFAMEDCLFTPLKSLGYPYITPQELNDEVFRACWSKGMPVVLKASLTADLSHVTPQYFIEKYGHAETDILKLSGAPIGATDFAGFFKDFSTAKHFNANLKIKDFPQTQRFADVLPCLYSDFLERLPLQKYMRYDGPLNLVSLLPTHTHIVPDLGPKMYAAYAGKTAARTGTTQLHLDPADAINVMQFMAGPSDEAGALWHVFRHSDIAAIRRFLKVNLKKTPLGDPIHDQAFYLTDTLLEKLFKEEGVRPFLIKQKVGEAIIIPAGCPHQVRNLYPCIKIALGFVTPESAPVCVKLAKEFCMLPQGHTRNSDILNIPTLLTQAWGTCMQRLGKVIFSEDDIFVPSTLEKRGYTKTNLSAKSHSKHAKT